MAHPAFGSQPLFARAYGTAALNPFLREGRHLAQGEVFRRLYSVWAYHQPEQFDVRLAFETFAGMDPG